MAVLTYTFPLEVRYETVVEFKTDPVTNIFSTNLYLKSNTNINQCQHARVNRLLLDKATNTERSYPAARGVFGPMMELFCENS